MTTIEGVDYSSQPDLAALVAAGKRFAVRYVAPGGGHSKEITAAEAARLRAAGIAVVIVHESWAARALDGRVAGGADATAARADVIAAGGPADGGVIYFAVDVDTTTDLQRAAVAGYLTGAAEVLGWDQVGVYGEYDVIDYVAAHTPCQWFWQTYAWSGGRRHPRAQLWQYHNGVQLGGSEVDLDRAFTDQYGQWPGTGQTNPGGGGVLVALTDDEQREILAAARQVTGGAGAGQPDYQRTIKAILATVQALINMGRDERSALSGAIGDMRSAVLGAVAAIPPPGHLTDAQLQQGATMLAAKLSELGIKVDDGPLFDALAARLAPHPTT